MLDNVIQTLRDILPYAEAEATGLAEGAEDEQDEMEAAEAKEVVEEAYATLKAYEHLIKSEYERITKK